MLPITLLKIVLFTISLSFVNSYKILVIYPTGSYSHQRPQQEVSKGLAAAGHEVTILTPNPFETNDPKIRQIDINVTYNAMKVFSMSDRIGRYGFFEFFGVYIKNISESVFEIPEVMEIYKKTKNEKFDAIVMEPLFHFPFFVIKEIYDAPMIGLASLEMMPGFHKAMGNVIHPVLHPSLFLEQVDKPSLWERIDMVYFQFWLDYYDNYLLRPASDAIIEKYFPELKVKSDSLIKSFDFMIEGSTPVLGTVRPLVPNTVQIGFLHITEPKKLPTGLQTYLDESENGVIYLSFGSNVKSAQLRPQVRQVLIETIKKLKYNVIWKFENETLADKPDNCKIQKWLPQQDLLAHKNIKLFITQGGLQSMEETISRGVPVVVIPFFGDQDANADRIVKLGIGRRVNLDELSVEKLEANILEVINNPK
ncbi:UDP-glycosyltransferase UGT5-like [Culicoides brevitarsis]|uniref:UDP-glycosyltransferase UGT5-like n=1 Tax=Culicoides brevitarsis TaxID=469753 RepID=UPI00307C59D5